MGAGRPFGSVKAKVMTDALILALNRLAEDGQTKKLSMIATALVEKAAAGDVNAIREVYDRVDGKVMTTIAASINYPLFEQNIDESDAG